MAIDIQSPQSTAELTEFLEFQDRINEQRGAWWPTIVPMTLPMLQGEGPSARQRQFLPLVARTDGDVVARVLAVVDDRYRRHWNEALGHTTMFEALPDHTDAVRRMLDEACGWLREKGVEGARAGFGIGDFPFLIDAYDTLPPVLLRQNPPYYHTLLKEGGFESERGWVDYRIEVTDEHIQRWTRFLEDARARGFDIVPLRDVAEDRRLDDFVPTWNEAFASHWGVVPQLVEEFRDLLEFLGPMGMLDCSVVAYRDGEPMGVVWCTPETASVLAARGPGRELADHEKVNFLGIGVREPARRQGVNLAMAAYAYLELARRGARYVSYTLVLDDNWPSRRTAEKLGATICANYMVYRRNFDRR
ncbi:MAG TPA: GNAT family N-acetyltransferase [Actinomycetota bacterium]|nr:GNAT family N-acetyltransferase [Actinomycetota bacterium]